MLGGALLALGVVVAIAFYVGLGYLVVAGVRLAIILARRGVREAKLARRSRDFGGEAYPTLLEVAASRVEPGPVSQRPHQPTRRAA